MNTRQYAITRNTREGSNLEVRQIEYANGLLEITEALTMLKDFLGLSTFSTYSIGNHKYIIEYIPFDKNISGSGLVSVNKDSMFSGLFPLNSINEVYNLYYILSMHINDMNTYKHLYYKDFPEIGGNPKIVYKKVIFELISEDNIQYIALKDNRDYRIESTPKNAIYKVKDLYELLVANGTINQNIIACFGPYVESIKIDKMYTQYNSEKYPFEYHIRRERNGNAKIYFEEKILECYDGNVCGVFKTFILNHINSFHILSDNIK